MTKPKTKLVCRGWVIDLPTIHKIWYLVREQNTWPTRSQAIMAYNSWHGGAYAWARRKGLAIAKKLWVES